MAKDDTKIAHNGGVGEVALEAGDGEFAVNGFDETISKHKVAFGVFKFDGIYLLGHGGGTNIGCFFLD